MKNEDIKKYAEMGFKNFKIVGRGEGKEFLIDSYLYFLVKEDSREFIRNHIMNSIMKMSGAQSIDRMAREPERIYKR